jgi:hypothetical protein
MHEQQGWGSPPRAPAPPNLRRLGVALAGILAGWAVAYGFGRALTLLGGDTLATFAVHTPVWLACMTVGAMLAVRRYDLRHRRP